MNRHFFKEDNYESQFYEYVLNITNHQEKSNQKDSKVPPHTFSNGYLKKDKRQQEMMSCKEKKTLEDY